MCSSKSLIPLLSCSVLAILICAASPAANAAWVNCATEGRTCSFKGTAKVLYGPTTTSGYTIKTFTNGTACTNKVFGDPAYGKPKKCWYDDASAGTPTTPTPPVTSVPSVIPTLQSVKGLPVRDYTNTGTTGYRPKSGEVISKVRIVNHKGPCIVINNVKGIVIQDSEIGPCGDDISTRGKIHMEAVAIYKGSDVTIRRNVIHDVSSALFASNQSQHPIVFHANLVYNIRGPFWQGQMVQMATRGGTGQSKITCNVTDGQGVGLPAPTGGPNMIEDRINLNTAKGLSPSLPIEVAYNRIRGDLSAKNPSGSGMQLGDSPATSYDGSGPYDSGNYYVHDNTVVKVNGSGISVAGGNNIRIENNRVDQRGASATSLTSVPFGVRNYDTHSACSISYKGNQAIGSKWAYGGKGQPVTKFNEGNFRGNIAPIDATFGRAPYRPCTIADLGLNNYAATALPANLFDLPYEQCKN